MANAEGLYAIVAAYTIGEAMQMLDQSVEGVNLDSLSETDAIAAVGAISLAAGLALSLTATKEEVTSVGKAATQLAIELLTEAKAAKDAPKE